MEEFAFDMVAEAKRAQWTKDSFAGPDSIKVFSPAKVNLFLGVEARREDGLHGTVNVMHALAMHDGFYLHRALGWDSEDTGSLRVPAAAGPEDNLHVHLEMVDRSASGHGARGAEGLLADVAVQDNLVFKAIDAVARRIGYGERETLFVRVEKSIPAQAGLGGGSSNAAATLRALGRLWNITDDAMLEEVGATLGADVPFFLHGGCALFGDIGNRFVRALEPMNRSILLVKPERGVSTAAAYAAFDADPTFAPEALIEAVEQAQRADQVPLFNGLVGAAQRLEPELDEVRRWLDEHVGADHVLLCGSGATTFAFVESFEAGAKLAAQAQARGWWARVTSLSSLRAAVV